MQALERELESQEGTSNQDDGEEPNNGNLGPDGEWDDHIPDDELNKVNGKGRRRKSQEDDQTQEIKRMEDRRIFHHFFQE
jgi:hypothetical protein